MGEEVHIVSYTDPTSPLHRLVKFETASDVEHFSWGANDKMAVKFVHCSPAGNIVVKEAGVDAKNASIEELERKKRQTIDEVKIAEYEAQIQNIRAEIRVVEMDINGLYYDALTRVIALHEKQAVLEALKKDQ